MENRWSTANASPYYSGSYGDLLALDFLSSLNPSHGEQRNDEGRGGNWAYTTVDNNVASTHNRSFLDDPSFVDGALATPSSARSHQLLTPLTDAPDPALDLLDGSFSTLSPLAPLAVPPLDAPPPPLVGNDTSQRPACSSWDGIQLRRVPSAFSTMPQYETGQSGLPTPPWSVQEQLYHSMIGSRDSAPTQVNRIEHESNPAFTPDRHSQPLHVDSFGHASPPGLSLDNSATTSLWASPPSSATFFGPPVPSAPSMRDRTATVDQPGLMAPPIEHRDSIGQLGWAPHAGTQSGQFSKSVNSSVEETASPVVVPPNITNRLTGPPAGNHQRPTRFVNLTPESYTNPTAGSKGKHVERTPSAPGALESTLLTMPTSGAGPSRAAVFHSTHQMTPLAYHDIPSPASLDAPFSGEDTVTPPSRKRARDEDDDPVSAAGPSARPAKQRRTPLFPALSRSAGKRRAFTLASTLSSIPTPSYDDHQLSHAPIAGPSSIPTPGSSDTPAGSVLDELSTTRAECPVQGCPDTFIHNKRVMDHVRSKRKAGDHAHILWFDTRATQKERQEIDENFTCSCGWPTSYSCQRSLARHQTSDKCANKKLRETKTRRRQSRGKGTEKFSGEGDIESR